MPEPADQTIVHNLIEALERLREDLDRVELWTAALGCFQQPAPSYEPNERYLLSAKTASTKSASVKSSSAHPKRESRRPQV
jgi:hypothetical protein